MRRMKILKIPARISDLLTEDEDINEMSYDWEAKARRLQARRWRRLKQQAV